MSRVLLPTFVALLACVVPLLSAAAVNNSVWEYRKRPFSTLRTPTKVQVLLTRA
jgi:hypothetical protein